MSAVVSRGPERHAVPAVAGMTVDDARNAITDAELTVGATTEAYDEKVPVGNVVTTNPRRRRTSSATSPSPSSCLEARRR